MQKQWSEIAKESGDTGGKEAKHVGTIMSVDWPVECGNMASAHTGTGSTDSSCHNVANANDTRLSLWAAGSKHVRRNAFIADGGDATSGTFEDAAGTSLRPHVRQCSQFLA